MVKNLAGAGHTDDFAGKSLGLGKDKVELRRLGSVSATTNGFFCSAGGPTTALGVATVGKLGSSAAVGCPGSVLRIKTTPHANARALISLVMLNAPTT